MQSWLTTRVLLTMLAGMNCALAQDAVIRIHADQVTHSVSRFLTGACIEDVNHEIYGGLYSQMIFGESFQEPGKSPGISGMWRGLSRGDAKGAFAILADNPFVGAQSQQVTFGSGEGEWGLENQSLNRWGMNFVAGKTYEGIVWARAAKPATLFAALESRDGSHVYAEAPLAITSNEWQRLEFTLTPTAADKAGRFALKLKVSRAGICIPSTGRVGPVQSFAGPAGCGRGPRCPRHHRAALRRLDGQQPWIPMEEDDRPARPPSAVRGPVV